MRLADGIRKHGFRKWYERELVHSHAHLVLTFLSMIGVFAIFAGPGVVRTLQDQAFDLMTGLACAGVGLWALRRYLHLLSSAETVAQQANCPACKTYGRLEVVQANADDNDVQVRCRKCGHGWHISGG